MSHYFERSKMKSFQSSGKFLATADRLTYIDITRATSFDLFKRSTSEADVKSASSSNEFAEVWTVYCNIDKTSHLVAIFAGENEARTKTENMLITAFGKSSGPVEPVNSRQNGIPAHLSPSPKAS